MHLHDVGTPDEPPRRRARAHALLLRYYIYSMISACVEATEGIILITLRWPTHGIKYKRASGE